MSRDIDGVVDNTNTAPSTPTACATSCVMAYFHTNIEIPAVFGRFPLARPTQQVARYQVTLSAGGVDLWCLTRDQHFLFDIVRSMR